VTYPCVSPRLCARVAVTSAGLLAIALTALGTIILSATSAAAHVSLISSAPADGSTPAEAPRAVRLTFSESVLKRFASIAVTGPAGQRVDNGKPNVAGAVVSVPLQPLTVPGHYTVGWRVVSEDGHPVAGALRFNISAAAAAAAAEGDTTGTGPPATPTARSSKAGAASGPAAGGNFVTDHVWHFLIGAVVVLIGAVLLWRERRMAR
jgi:methionine-rich copper-binding protein CopC